MTTQVVLRPRSQGQYDGVAELPRVTPTYTFALPSGGATHRPANAAQLASLLTGGTLRGGDVVELTAGVQYTSSTYSQQTFPVVTGNGPVYVVSSALAQLPGPGRRVQDSDKQYMPLFRQVVGGGTPPVRFANRAASYVFVGVAFDAGTVTGTSRVVELGTVGLATVAEMPSHLVFDRCHALSLGSNNNTASPLRPLSMGRSLVLTGCYLRCEPAPSVETKGLTGANCVGEWLIDNNTIIGGAENIILGGDNLPAGVVPSDLTFRRNWLYKPLEWSANPYPLVKNSFELKLGRRVLFEDNIIENYWRVDQSHMVNLKTVNQGGNAVNGSLGEVCDVVMRYNWFINCSAFAKFNNALEGPCLPLQRVRLHNNVVVGLWNNTWAGGRTYTLNAALSWGPGDFSTSGPLYHELEHNTIVADPGVVGHGVGALLDVPASMTSKGVGFVFRNNIVPRGGTTYGFFKAGGYAAGTASLNAMFSDWTVAGNVVWGGLVVDGLPAGNTRASTVSDVGFVDIATRDVRLTPGSVAQTAGVGGTRAGADVETVLARTAGCRTGTWT